MAEATRPQREALIFDAGWCEPCTDFVPMARRILSGLKEPGFSRVTIVSSEINGPLVRYYSIKGYPCVLFRVRYRPDRTFEIPKTRITGACSAHAVENTALAALSFDPSRRNE